MSAKLPFEDATQNSLLQAARRRAAAFSREEDGSLLVFAIYILLIMFVVAGMAVDLMRTETERARLQATLDRAVLAGASLTQTLNSKTVVLDYFQKAGLQDYIDPNDVHVVQTQTSKQVTASANMNVDSIFMNMLGINSLEAPSAGQAEESLTDLEISLVLDVSGSMGDPSYSGNTKIHELRSAASDFAYLMQCDPDAVKPYDNNCVVQAETVSISMVPYNHQVMAGNTLLNEFNVTQEHTNSACLDFDTADFTTTAIPANPALPGVPASQPMKRATQLDFWTGYWGANYRHARNDRRECAPDTAQYNERSIVPYESDYTELTDKINDLTAGGNTSINIGVKWGAALLDPSFRPGLEDLANNSVVDPAFVGRPFNYTRARTKKVMVVMTDGINTANIWVENKYRSGPSPFWVVGANHHPVPAGGRTPSQVDNDHLSIYSQERDDDGHKPFLRLDHTDWWGNPKWSWNPDGGNNATQLDWADVWERYHVKTVADAMDKAGYSDDRWWEFVDYAQGSAKDTMLLNMCDAAKAQGVLIFTIGFETTSHSNQVLQQCASSPSHHYDVQGLELTEAFNSIARKIHDLRLTN